MEEIKLKDIADELLIFNRHTIETLFKLDNCADCIALYVFLYKTAKWQKTNTVKATDIYIKKCLKWGISRIRGAKKALMDNGLITIVQRRAEGKIEGWFIEISYLVAQEKIEGIKVTDIKNTQNQLVENSTNGICDTNALKEEDKMLKEKKLKEDATLSIENEIVNYTVNEKLRAMLREFVEYRIQKRERMSERAFKLMLKKLEGFTDEEQIDALETSIISNWAGVFPKHKGGTEEQKNIGKVAHGNEDYNEDFDMESYMERRRRQG